ncbi:MAG: 7-carboxy-7-deazaguanine synthase QueE [Sedimentisphaerales bacterium]|nr:7-carboxy-7-deazaguanine synthase QueE [Sedimentisphaerales bacterium]
MWVSEIFYSLQGEGFLAGIPSVFIRLAGCPLRCKWCDTKYAWEETAGKDYSIGSILKLLQQWPCDFVVITGGEPMVNSDLTVRNQLPDLTRSLKALDKHVTIETAGLALLPDMRCDLMSISPKLSNAVPAEPKLAAIHRSYTLNIAVLQQLIDNYEYQLKFVVESEQDIYEIQQTIGQMGNVDTRKVILMPQAATKEQFLTKAPMVAKLCKNTGFVFGNRLQILLWNGQKGK